MQRSITPKYVRRTSCIRSAWSSTLGGTTVELIHPGINHSDDATVIRFPAERVVYAVDFIADGAVRDSLNSWPGAWGDFDWNPMSGWIDSMKAVEALDFDVFVAGEGNLGTRADVTAMRQFFEDLRAAVSDGMSRGKSLAELQRHAHAGQIPRVAGVRGTPPAEYRGGL